MAIKEYMENLCSKFNLDVCMVNGKISLKETINRCLGVIDHKLLFEEYDTKKEYSEEDVNIIIYDVINVINNICTSRGRY